ESLRCSIAASGDLVTVSLEGPAAWTFELLASQEIGPTPLEFSMQRRLVPDARHGRLRGTLASDGSWRVDLPREWVPESGCFVQAAATTSGTDLERAA